MFMGTTMNSWCFLKNLATKNVVVRSVIPAMHGLSYSWAITLTEAVKCLAAAADYEYRGNIA